MNGLEFESLDGFQLVAINDESTLHERRIFLGLTQQTVADRADIPLQSYQQFENGKRKIRRASFQIACKVLEALEMDIAAFYHGDYALGAEITVKDGEMCFKATGKPVKETPSENK